jgi:serine/threonine protein kinase
MQSSVRSSVTFESADSGRSMSPAVSTRTGATGATSEVSVPIPKLHGRLMRSHTKRDPHRFYDVIKVLGDGSMGSVTMVKRKAHYKGGSARVKFVKEQQRDKCCFGWLAFCPLTNSPFQKWEPENYDDKAMSSNLESIHEGQTDTASASSTSDHHHQAAGANTAEQKRAKFKTHVSSSMINYGTQRDHTYALKSIHMDRVNDIFLKELMNEIAILQSLDHPNIVKAIETFDYSHQVFLVLEHCCGGDLYARDPYDEDQARDIAHSIVDAVAYMHAHEIIHRDLKYENIMFATPDSQAVKIIDFGLGKKYAQNEHQHDAVGTVYTMAPEVLLGDYDNKVDLWSCGVIAFMLLSSSLPFYGKTR